MRPTSRFFPTLLKSLSQPESQYRGGDYEAIHREKCATKMTTYYSSTPSLHLKGNWLKEAGLGNDTTLTIAVNRDNW
jgi:toxic protein SymE